LHNSNATGSSPPRDKHSKTPDTIYVLDIAGTAPQPFTYCALALRKPDPRRRSTQTWRFTDDGRLCCAHKNMCVQSKDGFMGLCKGWLLAFIHTPLFVSADSLNGQINLDYCECCVVFAMHFIVRHFIIFCCFKLARFIIYLQAKCSFQCVCNINQMLCL
jgi:hypothetical protein